MSFGINELLPTGAALKTLEGEDITVVSVISAEGGQGDVYRVEWKGRDYVLKWLNRSEEDNVGSTVYTGIKGMMKFLSSDIQRLVVPLAIVTEDGEEEEGSLFGYLMELIPEGFYPLSDFLLYDGSEGSERFKSLHAMIWTAMHLTDTLRQIHLRGLSCGDLTPDNVFIDSETGDVRLLGCDVIGVSGFSFIMTRGYVAPEIVRSGYQGRGTVQSDLFTLAILLFRLFCMDHPFEGRRWNDFPMLTNQVEDELFGIHPVYNMSSKDDSNRPDDVWAPNVIPRMLRLPDVLLQGFERTFVDGIDDPMARTTEIEWLELLSITRDQLVFLDKACTMEQYVRFRQKETIPPGCLRLTVGQKRSEVALYPMQSIFIAIKRNRL